MGTRIYPCARPAAEQRYLRAMLGIFAALPLERKEAVRREIARLAATPEEGRGLYNVLIQGKSLASAAAATGVTVRRLSQLRLEFLERMPL